MGHVIKDSISLPMPIIFSAQIIGSNLAFIRNKKAVIETELGDIQRAACGCSCSKLGLVFTQFFRQSEFEIMPRCYVCLGCASLLLCREAQSLDCVDFFPSACSCEEGTVCENSARDEDDFFFKDE